jgi:ABC-type uncharacterized transport system permease subunit
MPLLGTLNGAVRELVLESYFGEPLAHRVSVFSLIIIIFIYALAIKQRLNIQRLGEAVSCSISWVLLTVCFEFGVGHFVLHIPNEVLLAEYNLLAGRLWPLILFFTGLLPFILRKLYTPT